MPLKVYIAPRIGTGSITDPFRSAIDSYIDVSKGDTYDEIGDPSTGKSIVFVLARQAVINNIDADATIVSMTPAFSNTQRLALLDKLHGSLPTAAKAQIQAQVNKYVVFTITDDLTLRQIFRVVINQFLNSQRISNGLPEEDWTSKPIHFGGGVI